MLDAPASLVGRVAQAHDLEPRRVPLRCADDRRVAGSAKIRHRVPANFVRRGLGRRPYDACLVFHHLSTRWGAAKFAVLTRASGAPVRAGLDNGRGGFLTRRREDLGFGAQHEVDYWLSVVGALGAVAVGPTGRFVLGADTLIPQITYSPDSARATLERLGWHASTPTAVRMKQGRPLRFTLSLPASMTA